MFRRIFGRKRKAPSNEDELERVIREAREARERERNRQRRERNGEA